MIDAMHMPVCIDCRVYIEFVEDGGMVIGKCACARDHVMSVSQYIKFELLDVVSQSLIVAGIDIDKLYLSCVAASKDDSVVFMEKCDVVLKEMFGDISEMDKSHVIGVILKLRLMASL